MGHRLSAITTRTGDDGSTGLGDGTRVGKDTARIQAMGDVDELNSCLGLLLAEPLAEPVAQAAGTGSARPLRSWQRTGDSGLCADDARPTDPSGCADRRVQRAFRSTAGIHPAGRHARGGARTSSRAACAGVPSALS